MLTFLDKTFTTSNMLSHKYILNYHNFVAINYKYGECSMAKFSNKYLKKFVFLIID